MNTEKTVTFNITNYDKETTINLIDGELPFGMKPSIENTDLGKYTIKFKYDKTTLFPIITADKLQDIVFKFNLFLQEDQWEQCGNNLWMNWSNEKATHNELFELFIKSITI